MKYHMKSDTKLYAIWSSMKNRCKNEKAGGYKNYGGRGISVCQEWQDFVPFMKWSMLNGYKEGLSIDRIDVNGNYTPDNCRWVELREQYSNRRTNRIIEYNGEVCTATEWSRRIGVSKGTLYMRLKKGWSVERALTEPINKSKSHKKIVATI